MHPSLRGLPPRRPFRHRMDAGNLRAVSLRGAPVRVMEYAVRAALDGLATVSIARASWRRVVIRAYFEGRVRSVTIHCATDDDAHRTWDVLAHKASPDTVHALAWANESTQQRIEPDEQ